MWSSLVLVALISFTKYKILVQALNEKGESNVAVKEIEGYSGEDKPLEAPQNLILVNVISGTSAILEWNAVDSTSVRGHFRGFKIQIWTDDNEDDIREIQVKSDATKSLVTKLTPFSKNYVRVMVYNDHYTGPPSNIIEIDTPEGAPGPVKNIEVFPLGSSAFLLKWKPPPQPNGLINSYKIYYEEVNGNVVGPLLPRNKHITDPRQNTAKLSGLKPNTKYRLHVRATTTAGEGEDYYTEGMTGIDFVVQPDIPYFDIQSLPSENGNANYQITWIPNVEGARGGSHFFVKYREKGGAWIKTETEFDDLTIELRGLDPNQLYELRVVAVDGRSETESDSKFILIGGIVHQ